MKARSKYFILLYLIGISCNSITSKKINADEYVKWFESHSDQFRARKQIDELTYSITYLPHEYITAKAVKSGVSQTTTYGDTTLHTFFLRITANQGSVQDYMVKDIEEYTQQQDYFSFQLQNDIFLIQNNVKTPATHVIYQSGQGINPYIEFVIHFNCTQMNRDFKVQYNDVLWGVGYINFHFSYNDISKRPILKQML